jgi:hypothetical protein
MKHRWLFVMGTLLLAAVLLCLCWTRVLLGRPVPRAAVLKVHKGLPVRKARLDKPDQHQRAGGAVGAE